MDLAVASSLIRAPLLGIKGLTRWADLGCGSGLFTRALARFLYPGSEVHAVDRNPLALFAGFPAEIKLQIHTLDFVREDLPFQDLDGILMANSLHYVEDKQAFIVKLSRLLKNTGMLLLLEYETNVPVGNWVPYPVDFLSLKSLLVQSGFSGVEKLAVYPSIYGSPMYAAVARYGTIPDE